MKRVSVCLLFTLICVIPNITFAALEDYEVVASCEVYQVFLYAQKRNGMYENFQIVYKGGIVSKENWVNVTNETYAPKIMIEDIGGDETPEIVIVLTKGYGTSVLDQEVHVLQSEGNGLKELTVENALSFIDKKVRTFFLQNIVVIKIGNKKAIIDISHIPVEQRFDNVFFGNIVKYEVENNRLRATLYGHVAPSYSVGILNISYKLYDEVLKVEDIFFQEIK